MNDKISYSVLADNDLGVTPAVLHEVFGVPKKTIDNGTSRYKKKLTKNWAYLLVGKTKQIMVSRIPNATLKAFNIPLVASHIITKIKLNNTLSTEDENETLVALNLELAKFCIEEWPAYIDNYSDIKFKIKPFYAKAEAALQFVIQKINIGLSWTLMHRLIAMNSHFYKSKDNTLRLLINPCSSVEYFRKKVNKGCRVGFSKILVHGNKGKQSKRKIAEEIENLIIAKITSGTVPNLSKIEREIKEETKFKVSYRTIRRRYRENIELATAAARGLADYEINRAPYFKGNKPRRIGDYAESDGTKYSFISRSKSGEIVFERCYSIVDGHSGLSTGCIGPSENEDLALAAFKIFVKRYGFLPREVRHDGASAHTSERFERFKELAGNLGVIWRPAKRSTDLSLVERSHGTFITRIGNGKEFFIGEGIKSKRARPRPSPETIALYRTSDTLITQAELHKIFFENEKEFNNDVIQGKHGNTLSAQMKWNRSTPENGVKVDAIDFIRLFGVLVEPTVQKGLVIFTVEQADGSSNEYSYSIYRKVLLFKVNFKKVRVRYDPSDMSRAFLFSSNDEFVSTIEPSPSGEKPAFAQTKEGKRNLAIHYMRKKQLLDEIKEDLQNCKAVREAHEESKIPREIVSVHEDKDTADKADLDYFLETTKEVDRATEVKRKKNKKSKDRNPTKSKVPASLRADANENARHYR